MAETPRKISPQIFLKGHPDLLKTLTSCLALKKKKIIIIIIIKKKKI